MVAYVTLCICFHRKVCWSVLIMSSFTPFTFTWTADDVANSLFDTNLLHRRCLVLYWVASKFRHNNMFNPPRVQIYWRVNNGEKSEVTCVDNEIHFRLQVRGNHLVQIRRLWCPISGAMKNWLMTKRKTNSCLGTTWQKTSEFLMYAWQLNSHSVPCCPQLYSDPVMYR